ncbi:cathepsin L1-like [Branchiostoma floridae]|uniref:Cathepsin L1-like n=1 Tax=Branchiostoma floridae TaxID=7739 RepID=A0A9J7LNE9_BRAFL|nr:cathepsin L1-like [Branchiostoma floridae]
MRLFIAVVCVAMATASPLMNPEWEVFKKAYNRVYAAEEEYARRLIFEDNLKTIQMHNEEADRGLHTFRLGVNQYADMTHKEFLENVIGGCLLDTNTSKSTADHVHEYDPTLTDVPDTVDWRDKGYVTPVKNQAQCGSCWAFSTTGSLEGQHFKATNKLVSLSEQNLMDCSRKEGNQGCQGGLMDQAFKYIKTNGGIDTEECYPYKAKNEQCNYQASCSGATLSSYTDVKSKDEDALQQAVATVGPISVAIDAGHSSFQLYHSGVYHNFFCSETRLDHGVLAVGYGTEEGKDYWLVKNSWGESWGEKGYIKMSRNRHNNCGIATQASYPTV